MVLRNKENIGFYEFWFQLDYMVLISEDLGMSISKKKNSTEASLAPGIAKLCGTNSWLFVHKIHNCSQLGLRYNNVLWVSAWGSWILDPFLVLIIQMETYRQNTVLLIFSIKKPILACYIFLFSNTVWAHLQEFGGQFQMVKRSFNHLLKESDLKS